MLLLRLVCAVWFLGVAAAQPVLQLKNHSPRTSARSPAKRWGDRSHLLVRVNVAGPDAILALTGRGAKIVQYIPDSAYVVSVPDGFVLGDASPLRPVPFYPEDKLSADLSAEPDTGDPSFALIEFYPDVDMNIARSIVVSAQLQMHDNPDLLEHHLLVSGTLDALTALAEWDEVAYVFPAADELVQGTPLNACAGALTDSGPIGQSVAKVGYGWDGPGLGGADLFYAFTKLTSKIDADTARGEIVRAFNEWARFAKLTFSPSNNTAGNRTLTILFGSGAHGDAYPFDGPSGVLAHTFYPSPSNVEPLAGDLHFDDDENWHTGADIDLFSVALHETGHALGLGHSDKPGSVMYPYYRRATTLTQEDIDAILTLYAGQTGTGPAPQLSLTLNNPISSTTASVITLTGTATGGQGALQVSWTSAGGLSGNAVGSSAWTIVGLPLTAGPNVITIAVTDSAQGTVQQTFTISRTQVAAPPSVPVLNIVSPTSSGVYTAASATVSISGTAFDGSGITRIAWSTSTGSMGQAAGTVNWVAGPLVIPTGSTTITITAYAVSGLSTIRTLQVNYKPPTVPSTPAPPAVPTSPTTDSTPPALVIVSPALTTVTTSSSSFACNGTAKDNIGVASVSWSTSNGYSGIADGTNSWKVTGIPLLVGTNTVTIRARDAAGNMGWRSVVVTRR